MRIYEEIVRTNEWKINNVQNLVRTNKWVNISAQIIVTKIGQKYQKVKKMNIWGNSAQKLVSKY